MTLEKYINDLYNQGQKDVKRKKIINVLKLMFVDKETDLDKILEQAPITLITLKKYIEDKSLILEFLTEEEFKIFVDSFNSLIELKLNKEKDYGLMSLRRIIDDILNTRHKFEDICNKHYCNPRTITKLLENEKFIDSNFGEGMCFKVKDKILENGRIRMRTPKKSYVVESRFDVFLIKEEIHYLNDIDYRKLQFVSNYLGSGSNLDYVMEKFNTDPIYTISILSDPLIEQLLKKEHYNNLIRYVNIEKLLSENNLLGKKEFLFDIVMFLQQNDFDLSLALDYFKLPQPLFNRLLLEIQKMPWFDMNVKNNIKSILNVGKEGKIK